MIDAKDLMNKAHDLNKQAESLLNSFDTEMGKVVNAADPEDRSRINELVNKIRMHAAKGDLNAINDLKGEAEALRDEINQRKNKQEQAKREQK